MTQKRKIYDAAFNRQAVELSKGRKNLSELARELGCFEGDVALMLLFGHLI